MFRSPENKSLTPAAATAETLRPRVADLRAELGAMERDLAAAKTAVLIARRQVDDNDEKLVLGQLGSKEASAARQNLSNCEQTVSKLTDGLASHRSVMARAESMLITAQMEEQRIQSAGIEQETKAELLEFAEQMADYYLSSVRIAETRRKAVAAGVIGATEAAVGRTWGELDNAQAIVSRLRLIRAACGRLPETAEAIIRNAEMEQANASAATVKRNELERTAHEARMAAREAVANAEPIVFDFTRQNNAEELQKQLAEANPLMLCRECAAQGGIREGQPRKQDSKFGYSIVMRCAEHAPRAVPA